MKGAVSKEVKLKGGRLGGRFSKSPKEVGGKLRSLRGKSGRSRIMEHKFISLGDARGVGKMAPLENRVSKGCLTDCGQVGGGRKIAAFCVESGGEERFRTIS